MIHLKKLKEAKPMDSSGENSPWFGGQLLAFSALEGPTDFENGLVLRTSFERAALDVMLPFRDSIVIDNVIPASCRMGSDWMVLEWARGGSFRLVFVNSYSILIDGDIRPLGNSSSLVLRRSGKYSLLSLPALFLPEREKAEFPTLSPDDLIRERRRWEAAAERRITAPSPGAPRAPSPRAPKALRKALTQIKGMIYAPEGRIRHRWSTPDRWPHRKMWLWDSVFHAAGVRHLDPALARDLISAVFDCQEQNGFIPHMMTPEGSSEITQPPVLGMGISLILEKSPDDSGSSHWMAELYRPLSRYLSWLEGRRDTDGDGLLEWFTEENENCRSGESGMDNSVRFDSGLPLGAVDFNSFLSQEYSLMSRFARMLGRESEAREWGEKHRALNERINRLCWDEERGFYYDYYGAGERRCSTEAVSGFMPLLCGAADPGKAARLVEALKDPGRFGSPFPVPSISLGDPGYNDDMWRGPAWVNMNWLIRRGLMLRGWNREAEALKNKTLTVLETMVRRYGTFFEYYDCREEKDPPELKRKGKCAPGESPYHQVFFDYGWSACLYLDLLQPSGSGVDGEDYR